MLYPPLKFKLPDGTPILIAPDSIWHVSPCGENARLHVTNQHQRTIVVAASVDDVGIAINTAIMIAAKLAADGSNRAALEMRSELQRTQIAVARAAGIELPKP